MGTSLNKPTTSIAIDFILKNLPSFTKWTSQRNATIPEQADYEILQQTVEQLKSDREKLPLIISKQAQAVLTASYSHVERGLIMISQIAVGHEAIDVRDFWSTNHSTLKAARKEIGNAYSKATDAYSNKNLTLQDRTIALKIILFSIKMLHESWESLWEYEIVKYFQNEEIKTAFIVWSGNDYQMIVNFAGVLRRFLLEMPSGARVLREIEALLNVRLPKRTSGEIRPGYTALLSAYDDGDLNSGRALIEAGADLNAKDFYGRSVLHLAAGDGKLHWLKAMIAIQSIDLNAQTSNGKTALHLAAENGRLYCVRELIRVGAGLNLKEHNNGWTALHLAASCQNLDCVIALVEGGVELNAKDNTGRTALKVAEANWFDKGCKAYLKAKDSLSTRQDQAQ